MHEDMEPRRLMINVDWKTFMFPLAFDTHPGQDIAAGLYSP